MKQVRIEIKSLQNGKEVSYLYTHGRMRISRDGTVHLEFDGLGMPGTENERFSLSCQQDGKLTLSTKKGKEATSFIFEKGVRNHCNFAFDNEFAVTGVHANDVEANIGREGGNISLKYSIDFNRLPSVVNEMQISVCHEKEDTTGLDRYFSRYGKMKS